MRRFAWAAVVAVALLLTACVKDTKRSNEPEIQPLQHQPLKADLPAAARTNTQLGIEYARRGYPDLAMEKLKKAIEEDETYALAHATVAFLYAQRGDPEDAEREYRRALELDPADPDTHNNFGVFLCGQGKRDEAEGNFKQAIASHDYTTPEAAWTNAGTCARSVGDVRNAEGDFRAALAVNPQFPSALIEMAKLSFAKRDYLHARAFLQRFDRLGKPTPEMLALGARTERALGDYAGARDYELKLAQNFPDSPEASQLGHNNIADPTGER